MAENIVDAIKDSGLSIYDSIEDTPELFVDTTKLEEILNSELCGVSLAYPIRTRSKIVKQLVCQSLGYPLPNSFKKTKPRFPGQNFDTYVQKSNNLQIWNEEAEAERRYAIIRVDENDIVTRVRVVTGDVIAAYDTTGTLTHKYQARAKSNVADSRLVSAVDTSHAQAVMSDGNYLPIAKVYERLFALVGTTIPDPGLDQERNRGGELHKLVCGSLGASQGDTGQFPDVLEQLLEIKLQTAPTIDLGLVCPDSEEPINGLPQFRHCDTRYAVFYGSTNGVNVSLEHLVLATGEDFFEYFVRFGGNVTNRKLQIPLPSNFFD